MDAGGRATHEPKPRNHWELIRGSYILNTVISFEEDAVTSFEVVNRVRKVQSAGYSWLVAVEQGKVVGYAYSSQWHSRAAYKNTAEVSVYISKDFQSKGWGSKLYRNLFSLLKKKNTHAVIAGVTLPNTASVALHEKFGMKKVAHFHEVGFKFGRWLDVGYWQVNMSH